MATPKEFMQSIAEIAQSGIDKTDDFEILSDVLADIENDLNALKLHLEHLYAKQEG